MGSLRRMVSVDSALVLTALALVGASLYVLNTAIVSTTGGVQHEFAYRQVAFAVIGIALAFAVSRIPISTWERYWKHSFVIALLGILLVRLVGTTVNGAKSWIDFGPVSLQPSEFGKVLVIVGLAGFLASRAREVRTRPVFIAALALAGIPALAVFVQPDFGTSQIYGYITIGMLLFAGARWTHLATLGTVLVVMVVLVLGVLPSVGVHVLKEYQIKRLTGFLDPEADAQGANYQTIQAKIAIGSGQLLGRPDDEASQVQRGFLPEPHNDFIFATLVERHGFVGGAAVLGLYLLLLSRILAAINSASSYFGRLVAGGVATLLFSQVIVNVGMVIGVLPITGVPLPLFSYGGSSLWSSMIAIGLVIAVLREAESPQARYQRRTGRPVGGFGSLRATSAERDGDRQRPGRVSRELAGTPLVGGSTRRRRRRPSRG